MVIMILFIQKPISEYKNVILASCSGASSYHTVINSVDHEELDLPVSPSHPCDLNNFDLTPESQREIFRPVPESMYGDIILPTPSTDIPLSGVKSIMSKYRHYLQSQSCGSNIISNTKRISHACDALQSTLKYLQSCLSVEMYPLFPIIKGPKGICYLIERPQLSPGM